MKISDRGSGGDDSAGSGTACVAGVDLNLASEVQQHLLPKSSPVCTWCCIGIRNRMAAGLGGDYFDFITMPDKCQALFIGDVTGHGLHASVVMSLIYGFIHRAARCDRDPLALVRHVNGFLIDFARRSETIDQYFSSSLFYGIIDPGTLDMRYVNAGHVPALVLRNGNLLELHPTAPPVGYFEAPEIEMESFSFARGDRLLFYTDGITETADPGGDEFGLDRLRLFLRESGDADHMEFLERLFQTLEEFGMPDPPRDDCTAIIIDLHGPIA